MTTWFPYLIDPTNSAIGNQADIALPDFLNNRVVQLSSYWQNVGHTAYQDNIWISSSVDGSFTTQANTSTITAVSHNLAFDGANGGLASRIGTDGFLYVMSIDTSGFGHDNYGLSKINIGTLTETAFMTPTVIDRFSDPIMAVFKIGSTNYVAMAQSGVGDPAQVEVINVDTMTSVGSVTYP